MKKIDCTTELLSASKIVLYLRLFFFAILFYALLGCKAKQVTVEKEVVRDSIVYVDRILETPGVLTEFKLDDLCPETDLPVRPVRQKIVVKKDTFYVEVFDNDLTVRFKANRDTLERIKKDFERLTREKEKERLKTVYRVPGWVTWIFLIQAAIILVYLYKRGTLKL